MTDQKPKRPAKERFGIDNFKRAVANLRALGATVPASRFDEALRQRRRLMKALRKLAPDHPVLAELDALDGRKPGPAAHDQD
ncbi:hypothetical protein ACOI1H_13520 [Loktanella sp. DJP18]|uniref:hypothetical protein n=1 Tax=Loktanella sp. DJP18 TaxID=3409788 RepID=UPI003BB57397